MSNIIALHVTSQAAAHAIASSVLTEIEGGPQISLMVKPGEGLVCAFKKPITSQPVRTQLDLEVRMQALWAAAIVSNSSGDFPSDCLKIINDLAQEHAARTSAGSSVEDIVREVEAVMLKTRASAESLVEQYAGAIEERANLLMARGEVTAEELRQFMDSHNIVRPGA
jgi:hypothetical protein